MLCIYCGLDAGEYDEHEECVDRSMNEALGVDTDPASLYNTGMETHRPDWYNLSSEDLHRLVCQLQDEKPNPTPAQLSDQVAMWRELKRRA